MFDRPIGQKMGVLNLIESTMRISGLPSKQCLGVSQWLTSGEVGNGALP